MTHEEFEQLVIEALEGLPAFFKEKLDNVDVVIEDWPPSIKRGEVLLGLYQGVPKTARNASYTLMLPDKITIFQGPIEWVSRGDVERIKLQVTDTVEHEIAHHFGISEHD
jgi:predicted Zn-dependent protease with MMP-like domain